VAPKSESRYWDKVRCYPASGSLIAQKFSLGKRLNFRPKAEAALASQAPNTVILGALSVPVMGQAQLLEPASSATAPSPECTIKGNVNRRGERVYHLPGRIAYATINMHNPQKRWFCSEDEARAAGWRPARK
jgi:hypothetical protein